MSKDTPANQSNSNPSTTSGVPLTSPDLSYPIGRVQLPETIQLSNIESWIEDVRQSPLQLRRAVTDLSREQLDTPYRPGGWTVRQVVHHLPDSHMNTYANFRLALTEENPQARQADVNVWAQLADSRTGDIQTSLEFFEGLQLRWADLMQTMSFEDFQRTLEFASRGKRSLATLLGIYAWHGRHHVAHITELRRRMGW